MKKRHARKHTFRPERDRPERDRAIHSTGIMSLPVVAFGNEALREAFRVWWNPYDMGDDFKKLTGAGTHKFSGNTIRVTRPTTIRSGDVIELDRLDPNRIGGRKFLRRLGRTPAKSTRAPVHVHIR